MSSEWSLLPSRPMPMAKVVAFVGPTLSAAEARTHLDAIYLPPIGQGDVVRAVFEHAPSAIVIIDGAFAQRPAVRHKEILWAMARGVRMFGASSMGAIRAAELNGYGMVGEGFVYRWYRRTTLADDADVAVAMAPVELGSHALSDALVDMRLTLKRAERERVIGRELRMLLEQSARSLHFMERSYATILSIVGRDPRFERELQDFRLWLATGIVKRKKTDAIKLLTALSSSLDTTNVLHRAGTFELTEAFAHDLMYSDLGGIFDDNSR